MSWIRHVLAAVVCGVSLAGGTGCLQDSARTDPLTANPSESAFTSRYVTGVDMNTAYELAKTTFQEHFHIARTERDRGVIVGEPVQSLEKEASGRVGDWVGAPRRMRRVGEMRLIPEGDGVRLLCRVAVERSDESEHQVFSRDRGMDDAPNETPIARGEGSGAEQNATWSPRGRDRELEREILSSLLRRLQQAEPPSGR